MIFVWYLQLALFQKKLQPDTGNHRFQTLDPN